MSVIVGRVKWKGGGLFRELCNTHKALFSRPWGRADALGERVGTRSQGRKPKTTARVNTAAPVKTV